MAAGLVIRDSGGNITLDTTKTVAFYLGEAAAGSSFSGTVSVPEFADGTPWVKVSTIQPFVYPVQVTITSTGFTWSYFTNPPSTQYNKVFFKYGIY